MQTWEVEFEDNTLWRGEALSGRDAMLIADLWKVEQIGGLMGAVAITSCREVEVERQ